MQLSEKFRAAFGVPFTIMDGSTGNLLHRAADQPARDWGVRGELAREIARRGEPDVVEAAGPVVTLAVPVATSQSSDFVAMATLLVRPLSSAPADLDEVSELLGLDHEDVRAWVCRQSACPVEVLRRIADLVRERLGDGAEPRFVAACHRTTSGNPLLVRQLLRALETRKFQRVGSTETVRFRGKIIAATNRDLASEMRAGRFRLDLFYRLCADQVTTPGLAEQLAGHLGAPAVRLAQLRADSLTDVVRTAA